MTKKNSKPEIRDTRTDRTVSAVVWWPPELVLALVAAGAAWTLWGPLVWIAVLALGRIGAEPVVQNVRKRQMLARRRP